jgi:lambda family phage portal protein
MGILQDIRDMFGYGSAATAEQADPVLTLDDLRSFTAGVTSMPSYGETWFTGDKWDGGFGVTELLQADYWTLRKRSAQLFTENLYARGLIRRLVTNEINTGLTAESTPNEKILGMPEDSLAEWTEDAEARFELWSENRSVCDFRQDMVFGALQQQARLEALVSGDVLVVLRLSKSTRSIQVQLIDGAKVMSPTSTDYTPRNGHKIKHGVELDSLGRVSAYWVQQDDLSMKRLPAYGEKSGRLIAWLVFGTDKRLDDLRGQPLLSLILQSLKELDRHRDAVLRKKVIQSIFAMFVEKSQDKPGTLPITGSAQRRDAVDITDAEGNRRQWNIARQVPGVVIEELQPGEKPVGFNSQNADDGFGTFEAAVIHAIAWANEVPPEILQLAFANNYSASQAAINEFKIYLHKFRKSWGDNFCAPIHREWLITEVIAGRISAPGLLELWRDPARFEEYGAYMLTEWYGQIKPSTDVVKQARGAGMLLERALTTHTREARNTTGTCFLKNVKRLKRENELLADALKPMAEFNSSYNGAAQAGEPAANVSAAINALSDQMGDLMEAHNGE